MSKDDGEVARRKIFVGGLSYNTDDDKLRKYFSAYGTVQDAVVMKDPVSRRSRGFGFITYIDIDSLERAVRADPHTIDGRKVSGCAALVFNFDSPANFFLLLDYYYRLKPNAQFLDSRLQPAPGPAPPPLERGMEA